MTDDSPMTAKTIEMRWPAPVKEERRSVDVDIPAWVKGDPSKERSTKRRRAGERNAAIVQEANDSKTAYDFVLYGDSITQAASEKYAHVWKKHFGDLTSAALGVGGNTVEELAWRLARGKEKFDVGPKIVAVLIGINNLNYSKTNPAKLLDDFLLPWMRASWPESKIVLLALLPNTRADVTATNAQYRRVAKKHDVVFLTCGSRIDPRDKTLLRDGTHPAEKGYDVLFSCLRSKLKI